MDYIYPAARAAEGSQAPMTAWKGTAIQGLLGAEASVTLCCAVKMLYLMLADNQSDTISKVLGRSKSHL